MPDADVMVTTLSTGAASRLRLGLALWLAGMLGVVVVTTTVLPRLLAEVELPAPLWVLSMASLAQSATLLVLAVWAGVALAPAVGLRAPAFEAAVSGRPIVPALRPQLFPGVTAGLFGGALLFTAVRFAPAALTAAQEQFNLTLAARVLYGGVTEELLLRWGVMTALVWLSWRVLQHRQGAVHAGYVWLAILVSALLFAAGHLPAAAALIGVLDANIVAFVIGWNAAFGLLFGYLFWRYGLESAMLAHALSHVVSELGNMA
jgi:membrane protease YdiL (CAAX protease family)